VIGQIFSIIQVILGAFQLWDAFLSWIDDNYAKELEARRQAREAALAKLKDAASEEDFDNAQDAIVDSRPQP
jgi:hypothetical protein